MGFVSCYLISSYNGTFFCLGSHKECSIDDIAIRNLDVNHFPNS
jgi:hypothetical protein